jgi:hypothetical protein
MFPPMFAADALEIESAALARIEQGGDAGGGVSGTEIIHRTAASLHALQQLALKIGQGVKRVNHVIRCVHQAAQVARRNFR